jgi:putative membrane-bound dehydrogenase-like protein
MLRILTTAVVFCSAGLVLAIDHTRPLTFADERGSERPVTTPKDWARRRALVLEGMQQAMGPLPDRAGLPPLDVKVTGEIKGDGFTRATLSFATEGADRVPADLYLPATPKAGRRAAVLALHQTSPRGRRDLAGEGTNPNMGYAPELARRGYVVLCPDYPSFGDYPYDFAKDDYVSGSMKGVFNHMRAVDLLRSRDDVDPEHIGVIGHSLGGHNAMFLAAFDERVKAVVTSCGWTPFGDYYNGRLAGWTSDRYMPRLKDVYHLDPKQVPFDFQEVVAAIAPRWFFSSSPLRDDNFAVEGVKKAVAAAQPVFELLGASDRLKVVYPDCPHDFPPAVRQQAYAFLDKALANLPPGEADYSSELPRIPPHEPADALKTFKVIPGFHIEQAAAEPLVRSPVAMSFDENGRLFVVEMCDYSEQDKDFLGQVRMLEDADGDGKFEKSTVYADKLSWPTALVCYGGGVFVGAAPDIYYLKDTDGDGKADERRTVFTGFERGNVQGLLNSFTWTLDNRVHGATSISGGKVRRADDAKAPVIDLNGRDFSFDPRTLDLRAESGGAQHGLTFDDWGRKFVCSNSDHIQMVMFEDRYLARNPYLAAPSPRVSIAADGGQAKVFRISPVEPWRIVRTRLRVAGIVPGPVEGGGTPAGYFTGATGTTIYRGDAFPAGSRGQAFIGDVGSNIIHRKVLEPNGVGFVAKRVDEGCEFVASADNWFRPCQFANAPDGTLHVADMYREVIEHPASLPPEIKKHLDLTSGRDRGRIYRIVPDGYQQRPPPRLGQMTMVQLVATLEHRNGWHRDTAARLLFERADAAAAGPLEKLARESKLPEARMHALYGLAGLGKLSREAVIASLRDPHPGVRALAARLSEGLAGANAAVSQALARLADDADVRVRYQVAFSLGAANDTARAKALPALLRHDGGDRWVRLAVLSSAAGEEGPILAALLADKRWTSTDEAKSIVPSLAAQAAQNGDPRCLTDVVAMLEQLGAQDGGFGESVLAEIAVSATSPELIERVRTSGRLRPLRESLLNRNAPLAAAATAAAARRARAVRSLALGTFAEYRSVLTAALEARQPHEVQLAALAVLDRFVSDDADAALVAAWPGLTPRLRSTAAEVMFARPSRATRFLRAAEAGRIPLSDLEVTRLKRLAESDTEDPTLRPLAVALLQKRQLGRRDDVIAKYRPALELKGDPAKGRSTFRSTCAACHRLEGYGNEIGPNLAAMASRGAEAVLVNVLDPTREVTPQYVDYVIETTDGRTLTGMLAAETATSITLKRAENATDTVLRTNIKRMRGGKVSIMPEGLEQQIDVQGMADLIAYVMSVK